MPRVSVPYLVPVHVVVDTDNGTVEHVDVITSGVTRDANGWIYDVDTTDVLSPTLDVDLIAEAFRIAESRPWDHWHYEQN